ncbi:hypothetical protein PtB15_11B290 [Puccinia triticina]|nr:hypothetical protein PtB15_11B290 [Puccinia triticina]
MPEPAPGHARLLPKIPGRVGERPISLHSASLRASSRPTPLRSSEGAGGPVLRTPGWCGARQGARTEARIRRAARAGSRWTGLLVAVESRPADAAADQARPFRARSLDPPRLQRRSPARIHFSACPPRLHIDPIDYVARLGAGEAHLTSTREHYSSSEEPSRPPLPPAPALHDSRDHPPGLISGLSCAPTSRLPIPVDDHQPLAPPALSPQHPQPRPSTTPTMDKASPSDPAYRKEHITLHPLPHPQPLATPPLTYRSGTSSPTRCARAVRTEAREAKQAALEILHFHTKVALGLKPYQAQIKRASWSWIIPTVLLIIVSFPPLFGHELIILVAGMIWGLWVGFAIACAGTFLGEILTYHAFKHLISGRSARAEAGSVTYASLAKLMREGGLGMVILVRASAMPGHVCTAMQATIGIGLWVFTVACIVTLPKQFALVYVGVLLGDPGLDPKDPLGVERSAHAAETRSHHRLSAAVFLLTALFTLLSAYIVWMRLRRIRPLVQRQFDTRKAPPTPPAPMPDEKLPRLHDHPFYRNHPEDPQSPAPVYSHPLAV